MKKYLWFLFVLLFLIGCGPSGGEPPADAPQPAATAAQTEVATAVANDTNEPTDESTETAASDDLAATTFPATTVEEAAVIRDRDWVQGATDPAVTIIEYGDFQ